MNRSSRILLAVGAALALAGCERAPERVELGALVEAPPGERGVDAIDPTEIEAHVRSLAHDSMMGRAPGTPGGRMAADYIAGQFEAIGLEPVEGSYFQTVPLIGNTPRPASARLGTADDGDAPDAAYLEDFLIWSGDPAAERAEARAELVFVGYGIEAPEYEWDDYGEVDVEGKVLLFLVNDPPRFMGATMTYYGRWTYKLEEAARRGAAGALIVHTPEEAGYGWNVVRASWSGEQVGLPVDPDAPPAPAVQGWVTEELAGELLAAGGLDLGELREQALSEEFEAVPTGVEVSLALESDVREFESRNVVGMVPGDTLPDEAVVLMSHYDHLGVGEPIEGDSIYNGAYDNASGVAALIEVAEAFATTEDRPARSLLFLATTAEEQGLLGATWYVQNPLVPLDRTVAGLNIDGATVWGTVADVVGMGGERNTLGPLFRERAGEMDLLVMADPEPEKGFFFRSDHFPFARAGVPVLYVEHGREFSGRPMGWGLELMERYQAERYHTPADEVTDAFSFWGTVQQATLLYWTAWDVAHVDTWPTWHWETEFRAAQDRMMEGKEWWPPGVTEEDAVRF